MKRYLFLSFIIVMACSKPQPEQKLHDFLKTWYNALAAKDKAIQRFYDPAFVFPQVLLEAAAELKYTLYLDSMIVSTTQGVEELKVTIPFQLVEVNEEPEQGNIVLTIVKTEKGFTIRDMSQELAMELQWRTRRLANAIEFAKKMHIYDSIWNSVRNSTAVLRQQYDSVVFFTESEQPLFYVVNGEWVDPYPYDGKQQRDSGNYAMGVVTAGNKVIVPVEYTKIYNPGGTVPNMIEVESKGLRGLYKINGELFLPAEFEGIYPTKAKSAVVQVKKGDRYGWVSEQGNVSFDETSHPDKTLFQSPIESKTILNWHFKHPGSANVLVSMNGSSAESWGVIVYPSFVRDLGITAIAVPGVFVDLNELGMGMTDTEIKFEKVESLSDKLYGLVSFFMEAGADARGYQFSQNDLLVLNDQLAKVDHLKELSTGNEYPDPCSGLRISPSYKVIESGLYESLDKNGNYKYYKVNAEGKVEQQTTSRFYSFTKFVKMNESYLNNCRYEEIPYESGSWEDGDPNVVVLSGISSEEMDLMRNEIFAEYGFIFKSPKWKEYFKDMPWYTPRYDKVDDQLTEIDKYNIQFILDYQRTFKDENFKRDSIRYGWAG